MLIKGMREISFTFLHFSQMYTERDVVEWLRKGRWGVGHLDFLILYTSYAMLKSFCILHAWKWILFFSRIWMYKAQYQDYKFRKNKVKDDSCSHGFHFIHSSLYSLLKIIILLTTNIPCLLRLFSKFEELPDRLSMELECVHWDRRDWGWEGSFRDKPPTSMQFTFMFGFSPAVYTDKALTGATCFRKPW